MNELLKDMKVRKEGEKVIITLAPQQNDLSYDKVIDEKENKTETIKKGIIVDTTEQIFESKDDAVDYYNVQLERCNKGLDFFNEQIKELNETVMEEKLFNQIDKIANKLDTSKYKGKYKALDTYMDNYQKYKGSQAQIKMREKDSKFVIALLEEINKL